MQDPDPTDTSDSEQPSSRLSPAAQRLAKLIGKAIAEQYREEQQKALENGGESSSAADPVNT